MRTLKENTQANLLFEDGPVALIRKAHEVLKRHREGGAAIMGDDRKLVDSTYRFDATQILLDEITRLRHELGVALAKW